MKRIKCLIVFFVPFLLVLLLSFPLISGSEISEKTGTLKVVTSIPVETVLKGADTRRASDVWVEMINSAERTLDFAEFYIITEKGEPLEPVIEAIILASSRGVKIRLLIEKKMLETSEPLKSRLEKVNNIDISIFDWSDLTGGGLHAKYFIVDDSRAFIGSQNFDWRALKHIHETGLKITERSVVADLKRIFDADWNYSNGDKEAYKFKREDIDNKKVKISLSASPEKFNPPGIESSIIKIRTLISGAKEKITVQLLSYNTGIHGSDKEFTELYEVLVEAAARGVEIHFAVSDWNLKKPGVESIKSLANIKGITVKVFTIPEYSRGFIPYSRVIHSKVLRIDDRISMVSTSNWGHSYFYGSRNVDIVLRIKEIAVVLDSLFTELWNSGYGQVLDPGKEYKAPRTN